MKKEKFIIGLRKELMIDHRTAAVNNILSDYVEYYDIGLSDGKSENQIISELGTPKEIAKSLRDDRDVMAPLYLILKYMLVGIIFFYTAGYAVNIESFNTLGISIFFTTFIPLGIWISIGGEIVVSDSDLIQEYFSSKKINIKIYIHLISEILSSVFIFLSFYYVGANQHLPFGLPINLGTLYFRCIAYCSTLIGIITIYSIALNYQKTMIYRLPYIYVCIGAMMSKFSLISYSDVLYDQVNNAWSYQALFHILPFLTGILCATISLRFSIRKK